MEKPRIVFLDYLRVIACFMVMLVHANEPYYLSAAGTEIASENHAIWLTLMGTPLRPCIALFVIASSFLLFPITMDAGTFIKRRLTRVLIPFLVWTVIIVIVPFYGNGFPTLAGTLENLHSLTFNFVPAAGYFWFVYMLLGLYVLMILLSPWIEKLSKRGEEIFLALWFFTTFFPIFREFSPELWGEASWNCFGAFYYVSGFIGYLVLGHYFRVHLPEFSWKKTLAIAFPLWILGYASATFWFFSKIPSEFPISQPIELGISMEQAWDYCSFPTALMAVAYLLVIRKISYAGFFYKNLIEPISKNSYGMYLMHMYALVFLISKIKGAFNCVPAEEIVMALGTFVICACIMWFLRKIPGSKYLG